MEDIDINQRFRISDTQVSGTIDEIGELIPYKSGNGYFRNIVLRMQGGIAPVLLPITMFGVEAADLDQKLDLHRPMTCTARLTSRRYIGREGAVRWVLSMSAIGPVFGPREGTSPKTDEKAPDDPSDWPGADDPENLPF